MSASLLIACLMHRGECLCNAILSAAPRTHEASASWSFTHGITCLITLHASSLESLAGAIGFFGWIGAASFSCTRGFLVGTGTSSYTSAVFFAASAAAAPLFAFSPAADVAAAADTALADAVLPTDASARGKVLGIAGAIASHTSATSGQRTYRRRSFEP
jgi:hypothetical protein